MRTLLRATADRGKPIPYKRKTRQALPTWRELSHRHRDSVTRTLIDMGANHKPVTISRVSPSPGDGIARQMGVSLAMLTATSHGRMGPSRLGAVIDRRNARHRRLQSLQKTRTDGNNYRPWPRVITVAAGRLRASDPDETTPRQFSSSRRGGLNCAHITPPLKPSRSLPLELTPGGSE